MPIYAYKGYDLASGAARKGKIEAESVKAARAKLRQKNQIVASELKEETSLDKVKTKSRYFNSRVSETDLAIMTRQFATLQAAHVPLDECLKALTGQVDNILLRNTLASLKDQVSEGKSLGDATASFPGVFSRLYVNMVRAGESSGTLDVVLTRLADFMEAQVAMRGQIISAIAYPAIMICVSMAIIMYLFVSVVPKLTKVFKNLRVTLPWYTEMLIDTSKFLQDYWYLVIAFIAVSFYLFKAWVAKDAGRRKFDAFVLRLPLFGPLILRINVARFTQTLSTLLNSGVPIIRALEITRNIVTNTVIADVIDQAKTAVQEGQSLGATIEKSGKFPALVTHMIMTGERTGQLEEMLAHVAKAYDAEVERKIETMISLIEPAMIVVMGGIATLVVMALMMPMLSIMNQIR